MSDPSKSLVLTAGSLGDCVLTLPALHLLQNQGPVVLAGTSPYLQLGRALLNVEEVISLETLLQTIHADAVLDPSFWGKFSDLYVFFKDKDPQITQRLKIFPNFKIHEPMENFETFLKTEKWAGDYWLNLVNPHRPPHENPIPARLHVSNADKDRGAILCEFLGTTHPLIIHPGSGDPAKNAPLSFFKKAAEKAVKESGTDVLVIWGDAELQQADEIISTFRGMEKVRVLPDLLMLKDLVAVLTQARGYLGNDSGVTHLAAACGLKTFAVFNTTDSRIWGPRESIILAATQTLYR